MEISRETANRKSAETIDMERGIFEAMLRMGIGERVGIMRLGATGRDALKNGFPFEGFSRFCLLRDQGPHRESPADSALRPHIRDAFHQPPNAFA
jgi:hypothetical protein